MTDRALQHRTKSDQRASDLRSLKLKLDFQRYCVHRFLTACTPEQRRQIVAEFGA